MLRCQESIGYLFRREGLLRKSLTHSSVKDDKHPSNERLEFLGDAILGMVISEYLFSMLPENDEGDLTKVKSVVVSSQTLSRLGLEMGLDKYLLLGKGIRLKKEIPRSLIANAVEAVIAAVYLDRGMEAARHFVLDHLHYYVEEVLADEHVEKNYKSLLQQCAQRELSGTPTYRVVAERGPDHSKSFRVAAVIKGHEYPIGSGDSKKAAEQEAARIALADIEKGKGQPRRGSRRKSDRNGSARNGRDRDGRREPERTESRSEPKPRSRTKSRSADRAKPETKDRSEAGSRSKAKAKAKPRSRAKPAADRAPEREAPKPKPKARMKGSKKAAKKPAKKVASEAPAKGKPARAGRNPQAARKPSRSPRPASRDGGSSRRRGSSRSGNR
jgi:ribonuclease-3